MVDDSASSPADCSSISGLNFDQTNGHISFIPGSYAFDNLDFLGRYELKIIAEFTGDATQEVFVIKVIDGIS